MFKLFLENCSKVAEFANLNSMMLHNRYKNYIRCLSDALLDYFVHTRFYNENCFTNENLTKSGCQEQDRIKLRKIRIFSFQANLYQLCLQCAGK